MKTEIEEILEFARQKKREEEARLNQGKYTDHATYREGVGYRRAMDEMVAKIKAIGNFADNHYLDRSDEE